MFVLKFVFIYKSDHKELKYDDDVMDLAMELTAEYVRTGNMT